MNRGNPMYDRIARLTNVDALACRRVTLIGAGSMGLSIATQMARHCVATGPPGRLRIIDGGRVEERDLIDTEYRMKHIGMPKVDAAISIVREINPYVNLGGWETMIDEASISSMVEVAGQTDLLGLFASSCDVMLNLAKSCASICPQVMTAIGLHADFAEVGFSIPGVTAPLDVTMGSGKWTAIGGMGSRKRAAIGTSAAFGCDTAFIASFVASLCLELLLDPRERGKLVCCQPDAPLFLIGVREPWLFYELEETCKTVSCVYKGPHIRRRKTAKDQAEDDKW